MNISVSLRNRYADHEVSVETDGDSKIVQIPSKPSGFGSSVNGAELLLLSMATCFCNDLYREAGKRGIRIDGVDVQFNGEFGGEGESGSNFRYKVKVHSSAPGPVIDDLVKYVDGIAEIHNTLRMGAEVKLMYS